MLDTIWKQFFEFIYSNLDMNTPYNELDYKKTSKSLFANLIFNNLEKINFIKGSKPKMKITNDFTILFYEKYSSGNMINDVKESGLTVKIINKSNIVKVRGLPSEKKTVYKLDFNYNQSNYYIPHERIILTNLSPQEFMLREDILMTHLINQSDNKIIITAETLKFIEKHDTTKMLTKRILNNNLTLQAENGIKNEIKSKLQAIARNKIAITKYKENIILFEKDISKLEESIIFQKGGEQLTEDLMNLVDKYKLIESIYAKVDNKGLLRIIIETSQLKLIKYDKERLKKLYDNNGWSNKPKFRTILGQFINEECDIFFGAYTITLTLAKANSTQEIIYDLSPKSTYRNPHESINCLGTYGSSVNKLRKQNKIDTLLIVLIEYLQSITFGDGGASSLPNSCYALNKEGEKIYG